MVRVTLWLLPYLSIICPTLTREGVSLALNVKYRVLERLERITGAKIISSVDSMITGPTLGTCHIFYTMRGDLTHPSARYRS